MRYSTAVQGGSRGVAPGLLLVSVGQGKGGDTGWAPGQPTPVAGPTGGDSGVRARSPFRASFIGLILIGLCLSACGLIRAKEAVHVVLSEGPWEVSPTEIDDAGILEFTFDNEGSETHHPIVVVFPDDFGSFESTEMRQLLNHLIENSGPTEPMLVHPSDGRTWGHFHPGSPDTPDLPASAFTVEDDGGETIRYLWTEGVEPGQSTALTTSAGKPGITFGSHHPGSTYVVFCMNLDHAGRNESAMFELRR